MKTMKHVINTWNVIVICNVSMKYWIKPNWAAFLFVLVFFTSVDLSPRILADVVWADWCRWKNWLAEICFLEGKSWNECCPAPLILLWDATSDSDSLLAPITHTSAFQTRSPARLCMADSLWSVEPIHLGIVQATRQMAWGEKYFLRCLLTFHFPDTLFEEKNSNWTLGKVSEVIL